jgi:hypothetical protein
MPPGGDDDRARAWLDSASSSPVGKQPEVPRRTGTAM